VYCRSAGGRLCPYTKDRPGAAQDISYGAGQKFRPTPDSVSDIAILLMRLIAGRSVLPVRCGLTTYITISDAVIPDLRTIGMTGRILREINITPVMAINRVEIAVIVTTRSEGVDGLLFWPGSQDNQASEQHD
jgi:hypothetical protein